jgi:hypothetical protein
MKLHIVTREENEHNQYGEYFVAVFTNKPTRDQLCQLLLPEDTISHLLNGGGRIGVENTWYNLRVVKEGELYEDTD